MALQHENGDKHSFSEKRCKASLAPFSAHEHGVCSIHLTRELLPSCSGAPLGPRNFPIHAHREDLENVHILPCGSVLASSPSKAAKQVKNRAKGAFAQKDPVCPFMGVFLVCVRCWICCKNSAFGVFQDMPSAELLYGKAGMGSSSCSPKTLCWVKAISLLSSMPEKMEATLQGHPEQGRLGNSQ